MADEEEQTSKKDASEQGRSRKLTEKASEEKLQRCIALRRRKLGTLTSRIKELEKLMGDAKNVQNVQDSMENDFALLVNDFHCCNKEVINLLEEDEKEFDQYTWFEPKIATIRDFMKTAKTWIANGQEYMPPQHENVHEGGSDVMDKLQESVRPSDSISQAGIGNAEKASLCSAKESRASAVSRVSSTRARQEAEHAALLERAAALTRKQELEFEAARIQAEKEKLELKTALAESQARLKVLKEYGSSEDVCSSHVSMRKLPVGSVKKEKVSVMAPLQATDNMHVKPPMQHH